jgi:DNA-binding transcriptional regulator YdaS (Cro superfamily)
MKLHRWLAKNDKTATWLADRTGLSISHVSRLIERNGVAEKLPSLEACARISEATGGQVTADDFMPDTPVKKRGRSEQRARAAA